MTLADLGLGPGVVLRQRHRAGARVLRHLEALRGQLAAGAGEHEVVVVAHHAHHFDKLPVPHLAEDGLHHGGDELERLAQRGQGAGPLDEDAAENEILDQDVGDSQLLQRVGRHGARTIRPFSGLGGHAHTVNLHQFRALLRPRSRIACTNRGWGIVLS